MTKTQEKEKNINEEKNKEYNARGKKMYKNPINRENAKKKIRK